MKVFLFLVFGFFVGGYAASLNVFKEAAGSFF